MMIGIMEAANVRTPTLLHRSHPSSISIGDRVNVANGYKSLYVKRSQIPKRTHTR
jgi:hypothetical protein